MSAEILFGWLGSIFCTMILVPQIVKAYKTHQTDDISMPMLLLTIAGNFFWAVHATMAVNIPLLTCACMITLFGIIQVFLKRKYDTK